MARMPRSMRMLRIEASCAPWIGSTCNPFVLESAMIFSVMSKKFADTSGESFCRDLMQDFS